MSSIFNLQEECCGENCVVELDSSHYNVTYNDGLKIYHEHCKDWCKDELEDDMCAVEDCTGCPECLNNDIDDELDFA